MLFYILLELEHDLGEVETSFVFIADFYYQIFIKETSYWNKISQIIWRETLLHCETVC